MPVKEEDQELLPLMYSVWYDELYGRTQRRLPFCNNTRFIPTIELACRAD